MQNMFDKASAFNQPIGSICNRYVFYAGGDQGYAEASVTVCMIGMQNFNQGQLCVYEYYIQPSNIIGIFDSNGNMYTTDSDRNISGRKITPSAISSILSETVSTYYHDTNC